MPNVGPTLPSAPAKKRKAGAAEPQSSTSPKRQGSSSPSTSPHPKRRQQIGPAPPPADLSTLPPPDPSSSDSESDFGPSLPPDPNSLPTNPPPSHRPDTTTADTTSPPKPVREEWMLLPPTADGLNSTRMDPTKLKNRKFQTGKGAKAPSSSNSNGGIGAVWTETPEQKRQRLEDEVLGRKRPAALEEAGDGEERARRKIVEEKDREAERRVREYNEVNGRGGALMDEGRWTGAGEGMAHPGGKKERVEEDDPSKRAFDREKDMKVGGAVGYAQKREMLSKARNMGDRFARGSYL